MGLKVCNTFHYSTSTHCYLRAPILESHADPKLKLTANRCSLVPRRPDLLNCTREKRGSLVKLITCVTSGGTNFHIWHNSRLAGLRHGISHQKFKLFDLNVTISYESASQGPIVPSLGVKSRDLHGKLDRANVQVGST